MSDHLQRFNKTMRNGQGYTSHIPVATDPAHMEKLAHHKRSNVTYVDFGKGLGRNNVMYHLSDGYNLEKREDATYMDTIMAMKLAQKGH